VSAYGAQTSPLSPHPGVTLSQYVLATGTTQGASNKLRGAEFEAR